MGYAALVSADTCSPRTSKKEGEQQEEEEEAPEMEMESAVRPNPVSVDERWAFAVSSRRAQMAEMVLLLGILVGYALLVGFGLHRLTNEGPVNWWWTIGWSLVLSPFGK